MCIHTGQYPVQSHHGNGTPTHCLHYTTHTTSTQTATPAQHSYLNIRAIFPETAVQNMRVAHSQKGP